MKDYSKLFVGAFIQWALAAAFTRFVVLDGNVSVFFAVFAAQSILVDKHSSDDTRHEMAAMARVEHWRCERRGGWEDTNRRVVMISILLHTIDYRGDHAADIAEAHALIPGETVEAVGGAVNRGPVLRHKGSSAH